MGVLQTIRETIGYPAPGDFTFDAKELKPFEPKEKHPDDPEFKTVRRLTPEEEKRYQEIQEKGGWTHEQGRAFFGTGGKRPFQKGSEGASPLEMQKTVEELTNMVKTEKEKEAEILRKEEEERKARQEMNGDEDCLGCRLVGGSAGLGLGVYSMYATLQASSKMTGTRQTVCRAGGVIMATGNVVAVIFGVRRVMVFAVDTAKQATK